MGKQRGLLEYKRFKKTKMPQHDRTYKLDEEDRPRLAFMFCFYFY